MLATTRIQPVRRLLALSLATAFAAAPLSAVALPGGAQVVQGQASLQQSGNTLSIANTPGTIINWQQFSVAPLETLRFVQQDSLSTVLNRVVGSGASELLGALQSNGRVYLINPNGIFFGPQARIDVAGLLASTLQWSNEDFRAGKLRFEAGAALPGALRHQGEIRTPAGGQVYLIAPQLENSGLIHSPEGTVLLAAGRQVELLDTAHPDVRINLAAPADQALNLGQILVNSGQVGLFGALVRQRGQVSANSATLDAAGRIVLRAQGDALVEGGQLTANSAAGVGGSISISGDRVGVLGASVIEASGAQGGGRIAVGGGWQGRDPAIANARQTHVDATVRIAADATHAGPGGQVVVWADDTTRSYGQLSARGGAQGGDGGLIETSGRRYLDVGRSIPDRSAPQGRAGTWLLDPEDVEITGPSDSNVGTSSPFEPVSASSTTILSTTTLTTALGSGAVTVSTGTVGAGNGDIKVSDNVTWTSPQNLTLDAAGKILLNANLNNAGKNADITLKAGGTITQQADRTITANKLILQGKDHIELNNFTGSNGHNVNALQGSITTNAEKHLYFVNANGFSVGDISLLIGTGNYTPGSADGVIQLKALTGNLSSTGTSGLAGRAVVAVASAGSVDLTSAANPTGIIAGSATSGFGYKSSNQILLTDVNGSKGVSASAGDVKLTSTGSGISDDTGFGTARIDASGAIGLSASGKVQLRNAQLASTLAIKSDTSSIEYVYGARNFSVGTVGSLNGLSAANEIVVKPHSASLGNVALTLGPVSSSSALIDISSAGSGNLSVNSAMSAGSSPASTLKLTSPNGNISLSANLTAGGTITLNAPNGSVTGAATHASGAVVNQYTAPPPAPPPPTLTQCTANPGLSGCSSVLPSLATCTATPSTAGCSAVLPSFTTCTTSPATAGCSAVLPGLDVCISAPTTNGCTAVLPSLTACIAAPGTAGCSAVLPSLSTCSSNPTQAGCSVVLPSLTACTVAPGTAGCSAVLPSLATCTSNPTQAGCSVVLPSLTACIAAPGTVGCSAVLPSLSTCSGNPTQVGCSVVLPSLAACIAAPGAVGCSTVLPSLATCSSNPTQAGCSVILPTTSSCATTPNAVGCSVVLPSLSSCVASPAQEGCATVLPSLANCTGNPTQVGCSAVLPSLAACITTPSQAGCGSVLPSLPACSAAPGSPGCTAVLPAVSDCISQPSAPGCAVVLPARTLPPAQQLNCLADPSACPASANGAAANPATGATLNPGLAQPLQQLGQNEQQVVLNASPPPQHPGLGSGNTPGNTHGNTPGNTPGSPMLARLDAGNGNAGPAGSSANQNDNAPPAANGSGAAAKKDQSAGAAPVPASVTKGRLNAPRYCN